MKKLFAVVTALSLLLLPFGVYAQSDQKPPPPPVSQSLVAEGDFALKLVVALKLGTPQGEGQAEDMLSSAGISPKNGWIADYPVTPIVVGELQTAVAAAADARRLPISKEEALKAFQDVTAEIGLAVVPGGPDQYAENQPQPDSSAIDNYYYDEGPPVVTYYAPPWDYYYLYDWVPYPFWCTGFFFPGFFVLSDFSIFVGGHHHLHHLITNHFFDPRAHAFRAVDPTTRTLGRTIHASLGHTQGFKSPESRNAATSIFNRSFSRTPTTGGLSRGVTGGRMNRGSNSPSAVGRSFGPSGNVGRSFGSGSRAFGASHGSFGGFSGGSHSFGSFSGGHSYGGFSGGRSFGGFSGSHSFGGFSGGGHAGGFSGGGHFGGFSGGGGHGGGRR